MIQPTQKTFGWRWKSDPKARRWRHPTGPGSSARPSVTDASSGPINASAAAGEKIANNCENNQGASNYVHNPF
jgi:hypothetical protein